MGFKLRVVDCSFEHLKNTQSKITNLQTKQSPLSSASGIHSPLETRGELLMMFIIKIIVKRKSSSLFKREVALSLGALRHKERK